METLIKTTGSKISGTTKAAILLCELGVASPVWKYLKLNQSEKRILAHQLKMLGTYDYESKVQAQREVDVLEEALEYGAARGFYKGRTKASDSQTLIKENTDAVAKMLRKWMDSK